MRNAANDILVANTRFQGVSGLGYSTLMSSNEAGYVDADFFADPAPVVRLEPASQQNYEKKHDFERTRVLQWLL